MSAPLPMNEDSRLAALYGHEILDTDPEKGFDDLTQLASYICQAPISLVSVVDKDRQWFKSRVGLEATETPRDQSFCAHAILRHEILIVNDALNDSRFAENPLVQSDPKIRFYAGAPFYSSDGNALGTLCVIDREPRRLNSEQVRALGALARQVSAQLELRKNLFDYKQALKTIKLLKGILPVCANCKRIRDKEGEWQNMEEYVRKHSEADFTHGICTPCCEELYPELMK